MYKNNNLVNCDNDWLSIINERDWSNIKMLNLCMLLINQANVK